MADDKTIEKVEKLIKAEKEGAVTKGEYTKKMKELFEASRKTAESLKEVNAATVSLAASEARLNEMFGDSLSAYESNLEVLKQFKQITGDAYEATDKLDEATRKKIEAAGLDADAMIAQANAAQAYKDKVDNLGPAYKEALKKSKPFFEDTATKLGLLSKSGNKFVKGITEMGSLATSPGGLKGLAKGFTETFNPLNIGISILSKVIEQTSKMMFAVDKAGAAFTKTTGFSRDFDGAIASTNDRLRQFGVSAEDASKATVSLRKSLSNFTVLSGQTQQGLIDVVSSLNEIGVSTDDSSQTILSGDALGKTASQITKDYNKTLSVLAVYGVKSVKIFKDIAAQSAAAGVEVDTMMGIANKFDTFADSAKTAAKMNAILGTSFSGNNIMMMDHDKRIEHVIKGIRRTGVAFKNLDKFTQQAIANQLDIKNLDEARRMLGGNVAEYKRLQKVQAKPAKDEEALQERMKAGMEILEQLKLIMADFAVNLEKNGMIDTIKGIVDGLGGFLIWLKDVNPWMIAGTGLLLSLGGALWNMLQMAGSIKIFGAISGKTIEGLGTSVAAAITKVGAAGTSSSVGLGSLSISMGGVAAALIAGGAAISGVILSFAFMVKVLADAVIGLHNAGVGFKAAAIGAGLFAVGIFAISKAVAAVAASSGALTAMGPIGFAMAGVVAGALGVATFMSQSSKSSPEPLDSKSLVENADRITELSTKLKELSENKGELQSTFAAIGKGLEETKKSLSAEIQSTIANIALVTTGQAAGELTQGAAGAAMSRNLGKFIDTVGSYFSSQTETESGKVMKIQLDGKATNDLLEGRVASAHVKP